MILKTSMTVISFRLQVPVFSLTFATPVIQNLVNSTIFEGYLKTRNASFAYILVKLENNKFMVVVVVVDFLL